MRLKRGVLKSKDNLAGYIFISPWLISFIAFTIIPILLSLYYSFTNYNLFATPKWVGLENYRTMFFEDEKYWQSVKVTLFYVVTLVPLRLAFALFIAIMLSKKHRFIGFYRALYYIPSVIGGSVAVSVMWRQLFDKRGAISSMLASIGIESNVSWLGNPNTAIWTIIILMIWQFGSSMLIFLAGLKNISETYYEAAVVDGANSWHKFTKITLPLLSNVIFFNLIMQTINGFMIFTQSYVITRGGPLDSTLFYVLYLYRKSIEFGYLGYGSAMAWVLLVFIGIVTFFIFKSSSYWVYYESKGDL